MGCSPWGHRGSDTTERRTLSFSFPSEEELNKALEKGLNVKTECLESKKADARLHPSVKGVGNLV